MSLEGFPHSDIPGSKLVCSSPGLIAAYRVLHRLLAPRHSPYALSSLTIRNSNSRCRPTLLSTDRVMFHAHCVCVVGKNYRLQDIQLSKITPGESAPRNFFGGPRGYFPRTPFAQSLAGPQSPAPLLRAVTFKDLRTVTPSGGF